MSGVRALHIEQRFPDPLANCLRLQRVVCSIKRSQGSSSSSRLPITDDLMLVIWPSLDLCLPDHLMFWVACSLGYFSFLRASEFTVPSLASFSPSYHLGVKDIAVDSPSVPLCMRLRVKGSKTDPFRKGVFIHIGLGRPPLCTVHLVLSYLTRRGDVPGPLVSVPEWAASLACLAHGRGPANHGICEHPRQFLQPQLPHQGRHCDHTQWSA